MTISHDPDSIAQVRVMVAATVGLNDEQLAKYTELLPALVTDDGYADPVVFAYQVDVARELAVWMTSNEIDTARRA